MNQEVILYKVIANVDLAKATAMFRKIAELPVKDENRVLGQLLYGLALR
jgi:hypothetical protein